MNQPLSRLRIQFGKNASARYTSHLDLFRTWERTFRRAGVKLAYRQGFNPQPRLNIASALPLGCISQAQILDVWLEDGDGSTERILSSVSGQQLQPIRIISICSRCALLEGAAVEDGRRRQARDADERAIEILQGLV